MSARPLLVIAAISAFVQLALGAWGLAQLPAGTQVPVHWGINGEADGYADPLLGFGLVPLMTVILGPLLAFIPRFDPRAANLARSASAYRWIVGSVLVFLAAMQAFIVLAALGNDLDVTRFIGVGVGVLFVIIGNFLGKTRSSWFMGIRTPWTLSSERSWTRTHRLGGYLFIAVGMLTAVVAFIFPPQAFFWTLFLGLGLAVVVLVAYSYLVWRDDPDRRTSWG